MSPEPRVRVLLTGAAGFAGSHALRHFLVNTDWDIVCPVSLDHQGRLVRLESARAGFPDERLTIVPCDLSQSFSSEHVRLFGDVDYVVNYASDSHVDLALNLLEFARTLPALKMFVQLSTDEVYGACAGDPHVEWSPIVPSNPYSASKACQEAIAISYWRTYGLPLIITNTMNLIGEYQDPEKFVPMVVKAVQEGRTVSIHSGIDGKPGQRHWIHCRNLADGILFLLKNAPVSVYAPQIGVEPKPARYNVVGEEADNLNLAMRIAAVLGKPLHYELTDYHSTRPGHDARYALDGTKLAGLGWEAPVSLDTALKAIVDWRGL